MMGECAGNLIIIFEGDSLLRNIVFPLLIVRIKMYDVRFSALYMY